MWDNVLQIFLGCISSLTIWWLINIVLAPRLRIENSIQHGKNGEKFVRITNISKCLDAYNVLFLAEYKLGDNIDNLFKSTGKPTPSLERGETARFELKSEEDIDGINHFYSNSNGILIITVLFQSKFGAIKTKKCIIYNK